MYSPILLITGHVCSGKSSLYREISKHYTNIERIDIADLYHEYPDRYNEMTKLGNYFLYTIVKEKVITALFNQKIPYIEILGNEPFSQSLFEYFRQSSYEVVEINLCRRTKQIAIESLKERVKSYEYLTPSESAKLFERDLKGIESLFGIIYNQNAKQFLIDHDVQEPLEYILHYLEYGEYKDDQY